MSFGISESLGLGFLKIGLILLYNGFDCRNFRNLNAFSKAWLFMLLVLGGGRNWRT